MKAVIQRARDSYVTVGEEVVGEISYGLVVLLGVGDEDTQDDIHYLANKIPNLRIFEDEEGKLNRSLLDFDGELLLISQFTLFGDTRKGRRPSFIHAANPEKANQYYETMVEILRNEGIKVATGRFQTEMKVHILNDGPVTIIMDSKER